MGNFLRFFFKKNFILFILIILGFLINLIVIFPSGTYLCLKDRCGLHFWGANEFDGVWHLSLANISFKNGFINPLQSNSSIGNYNFLLDYIIYLLSLIGIPAIISYFKILPVIWFILFTLLTLKLFRLLKKSFLFKVTLLFMFYFGSSLSFLFSLYHQKTIFGSSGFLVMPAALTLINLQYAYSLIIFLAIVILLISKKDNFYKKVLILFLIFLSFGLKFYSGVIISFFVGIYLLLTFMKDKKNKNLITLFINYFLIFIIAFLSILVFYNPFKRNLNSSPLKFSPFSIVHPIIEEKNLFYLKDLVNARYYILSTGKLGLKFYLIELISLLIFVIFNFSIRIFGLLFFVYRLIKKRVNILNLSFFLTIIFSTLITVFFVQGSSSGWWNVIQFFYYAIFLSNFLLADFLDNIKKSFVKASLIFLVILINIPANLDILKNFDFVFDPKSSYIENKELEALEFLRKQPYGVVYKANYSHYDNSSFKLREKNDSPYVSALTGKPFYLSSLGLLDLVGIDYSNRYNKIKNKDCREIKNINYFYIIKNTKDVFFEECQDNFNKKKVFENDLVIIYKVLK